MKICIIAPVLSLEKYSNLGDCEMALTHLIVDNPAFSFPKKLREQYINYFKKKSQEGKWLILDNSAYEIGKLEEKSASGKGLAPELVMQAAELIEPSIVIAQDVLCDREATLESTKSFIKFVKDKGLYGKFQIMGVAQGKNKEQWLESFNDLMNIPEINQIGLSKISVPLCFGDNQHTSGCVSNARLKCTKEISDLWHQPKKVHLLGGDNMLPWELSQQKKYDWIYSNDSSACFWYGAHGWQFDPVSGSVEKIITAKPDLENAANCTAAKSYLNRDLILHNISILHKMSKR